MSKLIRFINQGIKHFFILDGENLCDGRHEFKNCHPDLFADSQFMAVTRHLSEEFSDSLVIHETLHGREYIVLKSYEGGACYLCCKVGRLALIKPQQSFTLLEDDLLRPAFGTDFIHFKESQPQVCSKQSVPRTSLAPAYEERAYMDVGKYYICTDVPASELTAVFLLALFGLLPDDSRCREVLTLKAVFGFSLLSYLYHSDIVALDMAGADEAHYLGTGEPAVCQHIAEVNFLRDSSADHLHREIDLVHVVLVKTLLDDSVRFAFCTVSSGEFLLTHPIVTFPAFLPEDGKVEKHLAHAIGNAKEESLEAEDATVFKVGVDTSDMLHTSTGLGEIRIIYHQTGVRRFMVVSDSDLSPKLPDKMIHQLAPVRAAIVEKLIEHIFTTTKFAA